MQLNNRPKSKTILEKSLRAQRWTQPSQLHKSLFFVFEKHNISQILNETQAEFLESVQERILSLDEQFKTLTETLPADSKEMKEIEATDKLR